MTGQICQRLRSNWSVLNRIKQKTRPSHDTLSGFKFLRFDNYPWRPTNNLQVRGCLFTCAINHSLSRPILPRFSISGLQQPAPSADVSLSPCFRLTDLSLSASLTACACCCWIICNLDKDAHAIHMSNSVKIYDRIPWTVTDATMICAHHARQSRLRH